MPQPTPTATVTVKQCSRCGQCKPLDEFTPNAGRCKQCRNEIERDRRAAHSPPATPSAALQLPGEEWRAVPGMEGYCEASSLGRVRSMARLVTRTTGAGQMYPATVLQPQRAGNNLTRPYMHVALRYQGRRVGVFVHQLVAWAFLGTPPPAAHVHHVNGDTLDNRACNLVYRDVAAHLSAHNRGIGNPGAVLCEADVREIRQLLAAGLRGAEIARRYGVSKTAIYAIRSGRTWAHLAQGGAQ